MKVCLCPKPKRLAGSFLRTCFSPTARSLVAGAFLGTVAGMGWGPTPGAAGEASMHVEWGMADVPALTGFTFKVGKSSSDLIPVTTAAVADRSLDFMGQTGVRQYALLTANYPSTSADSNLFPFLGLDGDVLSETPASMVSFTAASGKQTYVLRDASGKNIIDLFVPPPAGYRAMDNGESPYYDEFFEQVFIDKTDGSKLLIRPMHDFTGESLYSVTGNDLDKDITIGFPSTVKIWGYRRKPAPTNATTVNDKGAQVRIGAVLAVYKTDVKEIRRVFYDDNLNRIKSIADNFVTIPDTMDAVLTKRRTYMDQDGSVTLFSTNGRYARLRRWVGQQVGIDTTLPNRSLATVDINLDALVVKGKSFGKIDSALRILGYARCENGKHMILAGRDDGVIVSYPLDANGELTLTADGLSVNRIIQGPFAGGAAKAVDILPVKQPSTGIYNIVWSYPQGSAEVPAGTFSVWTTDANTKLINFFRVFPDSGEATPYVGYRMWPKEQKYFYAWGHKPVGNGGAGVHPMISGKQKPSLAGKVFALQPYDVLNERPDRPLYAKLEDISEENSMR